MAGIRGQQATQSTRVGTTDNQSDNTPQLSASTIGAKGLDTLRQRVTALTQPMPGHETQLVDFESRSSLSPRAVKALVVVVVLVAAGALGLWFARGDGRVDSSDANPATVINPAGRMDSGATKPADNLAPQADENAPPTDGAAPPAEVTAAPADVVVSAQGRVTHPGLLRMSSETRVGEAVDRAGGAAPEANLMKLNLAEKVVDGMQIVVDRHGSHVVLPGAVAGPTGQSAEAAGGQPPGANPGVNGHAADGKVNINTADSTALETLDGVGPATATSILEWRESNGPFASIEQLMEVRGIGPGKFAAMKDKVTVS